MDQPKYSLKQYIRFFIPSLLGIILFLLPVYYDGNFTVPIGILMKLFEHLVNDYLLIVTFAVFIISFLGALLTKLISIDIKINTLKSLFDVSYLSLIVRGLGVLMLLCVHYQVGPWFIYDEYSGGVILDLIKDLIATFVVVGFFFPLLLDFGCTEFIGVFLSRIMRPLFTLPGMAAIDCLSSFVGSGTVGAVITNIQFERGLYTRREACAIATNFSVISIPFTLIFTSTVGLDHLFVPIYLTVVASCFIAAIILPRIPPLSKKDDTYYELVGNQSDDRIPEDHTYFSWALSKGIAKADTNQSVKQVISSGGRSVVSIIVDLMPIVMVVATLALALSEFTSIFTFISQPIIPILEVLNIPEATTAAPAFITGFIDIFIPVIIGTSVTSEFTKFIIVCIAATQIIFMSESGMVMWKSSYGIKLFDLLIIFILRTLITFPVIYMVGKLIF